MECWLASPPVFSYNEQTDVGSLISCFCLPVKESRGFSCTTTPSCVHPDSRFVVFFLSIQVPVSHQTVIEYEVGSFKKHQNWTLILVQHPTNL